jgi:hypothetical protein
MDGIPDIHIAKCEGWSLLYWPEPKSWKTIGKAQPWFIELHKSYRPWNLVWCKQFNSRSEAFKLEQELKQFKSRIGVIKFT